jgi:hypothetical protein
MTAVLVDEIERTKRRSTRRTILGVPWGKHHGPLYALAIAVGSAIEQRVDVRLTCDLLEMLVAYAGVFAELS